MQGDDTGDSARYGAANIFATRPPEPYKCPQTMLEEEWIGEEEVVDWLEGV